VLGTCLWQNGALSSVAVWTLYPTRVRRPEALPPGPHLVQENLTTTTFEETPQTWQSRSV
jgi:hypothetical protein